MTRNDNVNEKRINDLKETIKSNGGAGSSLDNRIKDFQTVSNTTERT